MVDSQAPAKCVDFYSVWDLCGICTSFFFLFLANTLRKQNSIPVLSSGDDGHYISSDQKHRIRELCAGCRREVLRSNINHDGPFQFT